MRHRIGWVVAGVVAGVLALGSQGHSEAGTGPATIRITDREVQVTRVDVGARGTSPGDTEVLTQQLFNRRVTSKAIGHSELVCTFVDSKRMRVCRGTYVLPRGKVVVGGSLDYRQFYDLAVLGGTGLYDNARGSVTVTRTHRRPVRNLVVMRLVG
jgi:hypothetical protein